jgi:ATP-binding cassette subfamily F protein 3
VNSFTGTVIFVSHDRYFIDRLASRVFEVEGGHVHVYPGNYEDYLYRKAGGNAASGALPSATLATPLVAVAPEEAEKDKTRRVNPIKLRQMQERCVTVEEEIPRIEEAIAATEEALGVYVSAEQSQRLSDILEDLRRQHAMLTEEWEELTTQLEEQSAAT